jgi:hypothetical protein
MIDSNTVMLGAFTLIPLMVLAYRSLKFSYEKQTGEGTEKITMEFIPPHFHPPVQPPEIIPPQTEKLIHFFTTVQQFYAINRANISKILAETTEIPAVPKLVCDDSCVRIRSTYYPATP